MVYLIAVRSPEGSLLIVLGTVERIGDNTRKKEIARQLWALSVDGKERKDEFEDLLS